MNEAFSESGFIIVSNFYFLVEFEAGFIRLLDKLTNGSRIEVNITGILVSVTA